MIASLALSVAVASQAVPPAGVQRSFACQLRRPDGTVFPITGTYQRERLTTTLFEKIGDLRSFDSAYADPNFIHVNNHAWRWSWRVFEKSRPEYLIEIAEFSTGIGQILATRIESDGGRHTFEELVGSGPCNISVPTGEFNNP